MIPRTPSTRGPSWRRRMVASAAVAIMVAAGVVVGAQPAMRGWHTGDITRGGRGGG